ncbi:MAG: hypothetical protein ACYS22_21935, partial [Planctomycetota bacterium]
HTPTGGPISPGSARSSGASSMLTGGSMGSSSLSLRARFATRPVGWWRAKTLTSKPYSPRRRAA